MHRSIASAAATVVLAAALVACGGSDADNAKTAPTKGASPSDSAKPGGEQTSKATPTGTQQVGKLGDTLSLEGMPGLSSGGTVTADVTLNQYEDHAKPSLDAFQAAPGHRLVAAKFTILSTGEAAYGDTGNMGAKLVDSTGTVYAAKPGSPTIGDSFDLTLNVPPGEKVTGWVIFDVPESAKITAVQYEMDAAGLGLNLDERAGKWTID